MTQYTTGELAKLCNVTVRTVQFYDSKDLLKPSELTDGGRRLYTDADLERLRVICFLKDLGFSLKDISALMNEPDTESTLHFLLENQQQELAKRIEADQVRSGNRFRGFLSPGSDRVSSSLSGLLPTSVSSPTTSIRTALSSLR